MTIPNILTLARIFLIPIFVLVYYLPFSGSHVVAAILFALAAATDWLDGYLARNLRQGTQFGAFLDPVADKLIVAVALVIVVGEMGVSYLAIPAAVIVAREIIISGLREWMAEIGKRTSVAVTWLAKIKTAIQMAALLFLLLYVPNTGSLYKLLGVTLLYVAALLTCWSMIIYIRAAWPDLAFAKENKNDG